MNSEKTNVRLAAYPFTADGLAPKTNVANQISRTTMFVNLIWAVEQVSCSEALEHTARGGLTRAM